MIKQHLTRFVIYLSLLAIACNTLSGLGAAPTGGGGLTSVGAAPGLLAPETYADSAAALAAAVADLNRVQQQTLEHLRSSPTPETVDADLRQNGAAAMTAAQLAEQLAASVASQEGGSDKARAAAVPYLSAAQAWYLIVIQMQNARDDYKAGRVSGEQVGNLIGVAGGCCGAGTNTTRR